MSVPPIDTLYIDATAGVAGDMLIGAFLDLGVSAEALSDFLKSLPDLPDFGLTAVPCLKQGIHGMNFSFQLPHEHHHRTYKTIQQMIEGFNLPPAIAENSLAVFKLIAEAESQVHGQLIDEVHFHEVGALDSILDIIAVAWCFEQVKPNKILYSPIALGGGTVMTHHGRLPVPAPAVALLAQDMTVTLQPDIGELTTPTGLAILKHYAQFSPKLEALPMQKIGAGAGDKDFDHPNLVRLIAFGAQAETKCGLIHEKIIELDCNIDDCSSEVLGNMMTMLLKQGALDVFFTPIQMKKNRPALKLSVLCHEGQEAQLIQTIIRQTTTFGVRKSIKDRYSLERRYEVLTLKGYDIRIKIGSIHGEEVSVAPEYDDCRHVAIQTDTPLKDIYTQALMQFHQMKGE